MTDRERQQCIFCGGRVKLQSTTYVQNLNGRVVIVRDVPAGVCMQCGERYYSSDTSDAIFDAINEAHAVETLSVPVYHYQQQQAWVDPLERLAS